VKPDTRALVAAHFARLHNSKRKDPETELQIQVAEFLEVALPPYVLWTAINPLPGKSGKAIAGLRKAMGLRKGMLDLGFWWPDRQSGLIELKSTAGKMTPEQIDVSEMLTASNHFWGEARTILEVQTHLLKWGIPLKATLR
jgi:hypothetical protein